MKAPHSSTSSSEARGRRALVACGWALVLVVALDLSCRALLPEGWLVKQEDIIRARVESQPAPDVQVVGDSVARSGLLASALVDAGLVARNDAIPAGGTPKTYLLLARQFAEGRIPKALVIAHSPHTFGQIRYEVLIGSFAHWSEVPSLVVQSDSWTDALYGVLTRVSWILMHRDSLRDLMTKGDTSFFADAKVPHYFPPDTDRVASLRARRGERPVRHQRAAPRNHGFVCEALRRQGDERLLLPADPQPRAIEGCRGLLDHVAIPGAGDRGAGALGLRSRPARLPSPVRAEG